MPYFNSNYDGALIYYQVYNPAPRPISFKPSAASDSESSRPTLLFSHGWPMSSRMFEHFIASLCDTHRFRCVVYDRRGFGRSEWSGAAAAAADLPTDWSVFAADLAQLHAVACGAPGLRERGFVGVAASMGCAEMVLAARRSPEFAAGCRGLVWLGPQLPTALGCEASFPPAATQQLWASVLDGLREDRQAYVHENLSAVFATEPGFRLAPPHLAHFEHMVGQADGAAVERCATLVMATHFTEDLSWLQAETSIRVLAIWGADDPNRFAEAGPDKVKALLPRMEIKDYEGAAHGVYFTHRQRCLDDMVAFLGAA